MNPSAPDDETLMAFADGQLEAEQARRIEALAAQDARVARRIELFRGTAALAREALADELREPLPAALLASVRAAIATAPARDATAAGGAPAPVVPVDGGRAAGRRWRFSASGPALALAACLGGLVFGLIGFMTGSRGVHDSATGGAGLALSLPAGEARALNEALDSLPSGQRRTLATAPGREVELIASFRDRNGDLCREFALRAPADAIAGVVCRVNRQWRLGFAMRIAAEPGYAPASASGPLDAYLESIGAGTPLVDAEESAALAPTK